MAYRHKEPAQSKKTIIRGNWERILDSVLLVSEIDSTFVASTKIVTQYAAFMV